MSDKIQPKADEPKAATPAPQNITIQMPDRAGEGAANIIAAQEFLAQHNAVEAPYFLGPDGKTKLDPNGQPVKGDG